MRNRVVLLFLALLVLTPSAWSQGTTGSGSSSSPSPQELDNWFSMLRPGMWVKVDGLMRDGALQADEIKIYAGELDEWEIASNIVAVDVTQMTLKTEFGVLIEASDRTDLQGPEGHRYIGFPFFMAGDRIEIEGQWQKEGHFVAEEIEVEESKRLNPDLKHKNEHEVTARIESVDPDNHSVMLLGVRVFFSQQTHNKSLLLY